MKTCIDIPCPPSGPAHSYLSTACYHEQHNKCRLSCKYCPVICMCDCHKPAMKEVSE